MGKKFINFTMSVIVILLITTIGLFGLIIYTEIFQYTQVAKDEVEDFRTIASTNDEIDTDNDTIDTNIETPQVIQGSWEDIKLNESTTEEIDYSEVQVGIDKYFYEQLEDDSKTIYKALEANKENMKTGTYKIEFGNSFSSLLKKENGSTILGDYYQSAIEAFIYDNAEMFYLSPNKMYLEIISYSNNKYEVSISNGEQANYLVDEFSNKAEINSAMEEIEMVKNELLNRKTASTYNNIKMVHDYLVDTINYDTTVSQPNIYDVYGALVRKVAVCEGYARAFKYIMDEMNIPCVLVMGKGTNSQGQTENHAWNYVQLNGSWYAVDATWDDPIIVGNGTVSLETKYKYFLKGADTMSQNHSSSGQFTTNGKIFTYPEISSRDY